MARIVIAVVAEPVSAFLAVNVTLYGLPDDWPTVGVQLNVPELKDAFAENVAPAGSGAAANDVIASPFGSAADTVKVSREVSAPLAVGGAVTTGARSTLFTVMPVVAEPLNAFAAVNTTLKRPTCVGLGVQLNVPDVFVPFAVNVAPAGSVPLAERLVIASPFASDADTVKVRRTT